MKRPKSALIHENNGSKQRPVAPQVRALESIAKAQQEEGLNFV
jgi:hypothetical protein